MQHMQLQFVTSKQPRSPQFAPDIQKLDGSEKQLQRSIARTEAHTLELIREFVRACQTRSKNEGYDGYPAWLCQNSY